VSDSLGEALSREMARVRDELLPRYLGLLGGVGAFAAYGMRRDLDEAAAALAEGDLRRMIAVYESLKAWAD